MATVMGEEGELPTDSRGDASVRILTDWSVDRLIARLDVWFERFRAHMAPITDENPPPDFEKDQRDLRDLLAAAVEAGARQAHVTIRTQHSEGGGGSNEDRSWKEKIVFPLLVTLLAATILGAASNWVKLAVMDSKMDDHIRAEDRIHQEQEQRRLEQKQDADRRFERIERKEFP